MRLSKGLCYYDTYRMKYNLNDPIYTIAHSTLESMLKKYEIASNYKTQARYASIPKDIGSISGQILRNFSSHFHRTLASSQTKEGASTV